MYAARDAVPLDADQRRLLDVVYRNFARRGAALGAREQERLTAINQQLATLYTTFGQHVLADEEQHTVVLDDERALEGVPDDLRDAARLAAEARGLAGAWVITNTRSSAEPVLTFAQRRVVREQVWRMWSSRGEPTNYRVIADILALRGERAQLLGFPSHAHWILDDTMARTPEATMTLMMKVWRAAVARVREEVADMEALSGFPIEPWDYRYYAEQVRKARYDLDQNQVKPYLQLDNIRDAMFWMARRIYQLTFTRVDDVVGYHPDVTVYEVTRDGERVGLWYFDPYARDGKRSGAWMSEYRTQERFRAPVTPIVSNNANFVKGKPGEPVLISWDDAVTMFHEFGHALHGLLSNIRFPTLAGTNTLRDFVEFPSQLHEHWLATPELLEKFALHHQTGEAIPAALVEKLQRAKHFNQGFKTVEYLAAAIYDMKIHTAPTSSAIDPREFEERTMTLIGAPREIIMRHRPAHFAHVFTGDGYSAGYYSYLWADTLTADAGEAFAEAGSYYDPAVAARLHDAVMSVGNAVPPEEAFRQFRGRDVDTDALMRDRGFPITR
ncbi:MAG: M3 family metallopeptidase [Myxococcota bacterium]|nr:M3 family metallopeptidase [Myxococcota bacterium]